MGYDFFSGAKLVRKGRPCEIVLAVDTDICEPLWVKNVEVASGFVGFCVYLLFWIMKGFSCVLVIW